MGAFDDFVASVSSFQYLKETVIILAAVIVAVAAILIYRNHLIKARRARQNSEYYNQQMYNQQGYVNPQMQQEPPRENVPPQQAYYQQPQDQPGYAAQTAEPGPEKERIPPQQNNPQPQNWYPGSIVVIGNYTLYNDRIQVSPRKSIFYDEITNIRYESSYSDRVVITIGHAWELSLSADDQTLRLYKSIMSVMNSEIVMQQVGRKKRMLSS